jgi:ribose transport system substrate-binding protein
MRRPSFAVFLTTDDNEYQREQASAARRAADHHGVDLQIIYSRNEIVEQSQQLLELIQAPAASRPDAIIVEPVSGAGLPRVAEAALDAGIAWALLNCDADYIGELRKISKVPIFAITSDHVAIGRIQGRLLRAILPGGGSVLYVQGPSMSSAAQQRAAGMEETKPKNIVLRAVKGQWTEESACRAVSSWLSLDTSRGWRIDAVAAQNDPMALGARRAFHENACDTRLLNVPYLGIDGLPKEGRGAVDHGILTATICVPTNTDLAIDMLVATSGDQSTPPERTLTSPESYPSLEELSAKVSKSSFIKG